MFRIRMGVLQTDSSGRALGMVHAIPVTISMAAIVQESWVPEGPPTSNCVLYRLFEKHSTTSSGCMEPVAESLVPWLEGEHTDARMVRVIVDGSSAFEQIRQQLANNLRFKFLSHVRRVDNEMARATKEFPEGAVQGGLLSFFEDEREQPLH